MTSLLTRQNDYYVFERYNLCYKIYEQLTSEIKFKRYGKCTLCQTDRKVLRVSYLGTFKLTVMEPT